ncbi:uncharacterized protein LOC119083531 [Bradysia coprophila]|uniref:uncharacterized protein LOC119083531 n=1 Tax=Bradysia coprophila TaxID=38358 RepID=UPI00187DA576|nr:uncharacterized protein LOC119083531 [Bradysia coprophila]
MPLIWNNKEYKLVNDNSEWNKLDFVIARKLRVVYNEPITIDRVKKSFTIYGDIEKIETFRDNSSKTQFAHVTFKDSRMTYLALIDSKENPHHDMKQIQPADVHQQPDNPIDLSMSPFYNLPDDCLLAIFGHCDITSLATLSVVCKRMFQLLRDRVFSNKLKLKTVALSKVNVVDNLVTVGRLVQCIDPKTFHIKIRKSSDCLHWPSVAVDFVGSDENKLSVDVSFYKTEWLCALDPIVRLIKTVCIQRSVYDQNVPFNGSGKMSWPNATLLIMRGFSTKRSVPDFTSIVAAMPNLETIYIQCLLFKMNLRSLYNKNLKKICFENCSFNSDISKDRLVQMANHVKAHGTNFPLSLIFDRIQTIRHQHVTYPLQFGGGDDELDDDDDDDSENNDDYKHQFKDPEYITIVQESTYSDIMKALNDPTVSEYLYIEVGKIYRD